LVVHVFHIGVIVGQMLLNDRLGAGPRGELFVPDYEGAVIEGVLGKEVFGNGRFSVLYPLMVFGWSDAWIMWTGEGYVTEEGGLGVLLFF
jgi:hypothetical protein